MFTQWPITGQRESEVYNLTQQYGWASPTTLREGNQDVPYDSTCKKFEKCRTALRYENSGSAYSWKSIDWRRWRGAIKELTRFCLWIWVLVKCWCSACENSSMCTVDLYTVLHVLCIIKPLIIGFTKQLHICLFLTTSIYRCQFEIECPCPMCWSAMCPGGDFLCP